GGVAPVIDGVFRPRSQDEIVLPEGNWLARGAGRSYGDSCSPDGGGLIDMRSLDRVVSFDTANGVIRAEAGMTIGALIRHVAPHGWFPAVVPGTQHVTLGGALANDIHGKNHHGVGTFGAHVRSFGLWRSDGTRIECSPQAHLPLFLATIGGMGLTGLVTTIELQLIRVASTDIVQKATPIADLSDFFRRAEDSSEAYTVAWIDSLARGAKLGQGVFLAGDHAEDGPSVSLRERPRITVPVTPPFSLINRPSLRAFNAAYRWRALAGPPLKRVSAGAFFFPLDAVGQWNRLYGPRGLRQHQCVIPASCAESTIARMLEATQAAGQGSFLTVLKLFGDRASPGLMSFPRPGATLTLDFPAGGTETDSLLDRLDALVLEAGGAVSAYKDARMSSATFRASFPDTELFRASMDPHALSAFARRVGLSPKSEIRRAA
ncbi:MAG: FAD-binding oxidoreductase, partial [Beijerinckiaceae bacterium]